MAWPDWTSKQAKTEFPDIMDVCNAISSGHGALRCTYDDITHHCCTIQIKCIKKDSGGSRLIAPRTSNHCAGSLSFPS